jgi:hypothetical protein
VSDNHTKNDGPIDDITTETLEGWIRRDSSRSGETDLRQRLEGSERSGYLNSWIRFEHG